MSGYDIDDVYVSASEVEKITGTSFRTIQNWANQGKIVKKNGKYGLISALQYKSKRLSERLEEYQASGGAIGSLKAQKLQAEVDKEKALARIRNVEADKLEGSLVEAEEVQGLWRDCILRCRAKLLSLPNKLASEMASLTSATEIEETLRKTMDEALLELSSMQSG